MEIAVGLLIWASLLCLAGYSGRKGEVSAFVVFLIHMAGFVMGAFVFGSLLPRMP